MSLSPERKLPKKLSKIKAGVVGWPIGHSLSPRLHRYWLKRYNIDGCYQAFAIRPERLADFIAAMADNDLAGLNLTMPHKEAVLPLLSDMDSAARKIGAVNMLTRHGTKLSGRNTDEYGFLANLREGAPHWKPADGPAVILGAGGAARAVIAGLLTAGVSEIRLINRTAKRAEKLAGQFDDSRLSVGDWDRRDDLLPDISLLVNVTILGMTGQPPLDLDLAKLPLSAVVNDIVYNPLETDLLKQAELRGNVCVDGLGMLLHQAVPAFHQWFGVKPAVDRKLRQYMLAGPG